MKVALSINSIRRRHAQLVRVIALFFLLYTGADILMPQYFCGGEEIGSLPLQGSVMVADTGTANKIDELTIYSSHDSAPDQPPDQAPHEEDCFCCCAHVLPGLSFPNIGFSQLKSARAPDEANRLLSPPLQSTYHPPRFA